MLTQDDLARIRIIIRGELKRNNKNRYTSFFESNKDNKQCVECDDDDDD